MRHTMRGLGVLLAALLAAAVAYAAYQPIPMDTANSTVSFTAETLLFDVDGAFEDYRISVDGDPTKPEKARVKAVVDVASIDTRNETRDDHLRGPDFFDAAKYPKITFTSSKIQKHGKRLDMTGTLDMHGQTRQVTIPFKIVTGKNGAGNDTKSFKATMKVDRNDWGIGTESVAAKISLHDEVELKLTIDERQPERQLQQVGPAEATQARAE